MSLCSVAQAAISVLEARSSLRRILETCFSTVFYVEEGDEERTAIPVGAFADARFVPPTVSVFEERRHSWVSIPDDAEKLHKIVALWGCITPP
jgi:hypothetical protein